MPAVGKNVKVCRRPGLHGTVSSSPEYLSKQQWLQKPDDGGGRRTVAACHRACASSSPPSGGKSNTCGLLCRCPLPLPHRTWRSTTATVEVERYRVRADKLGTVRHSGGRSATRTPMIQVDNWLGEPRRRKEFQS